MLVTNGIYITPRNLAERMYAKAGLRMYVTMSASDYGLSISLLNEKKTWKEMDRLVKVIFRGKTTWLEPGDYATFQMYSAADYFPEAYALNHGLP